MFELKSLIWLPDLVLGLVGRIPASVIHNLGKAFAIKMVFWHLALERFEGAYVEFGVAGGNSLRAAEVAERTSFSRSLGVPHIPRHLYGFDTFAGFQTTDEADSHATWEGSRFSVPAERVRKRFSSEADRVTLVEVDASELCYEENQLSLNELVKSDVIAIAMFDMDLGGPTASALEWIEPKLISGSILIFDELLAFLSDPKRGEAGALNQFLQAHPDISLRRFRSYGDGGVVFQVHRSNTPNHEPKPTLFQ